MAPAAACRACRLTRFQSPALPGSLPLQLGAVVATPMLTQLLLGTLVPVDAAALLVSTLQVGWWACPACWYLPYPARDRQLSLAALGCLCSLTAATLLLPRLPQVVLVPVLVGAAINTFFHKQARRLVCIRVTVHSFVLWGGAGRARPGLQGAASTA